MRAREYYRVNTLQIKRDFGTCSVKNYFLFGFISGKQKISYDENGRLKFSNMKFVQTLEIKKKLSNLISLFIERTLLSNRIVLFLHFIKQTFYIKHDFRCFKQ